MHTRRRSSVYPPLLLYIIVAAALLGGCTRTSGEESPSLVPSAAAAPAGEQANAPAVSAGQPATTLASPSSRSARNPATSAPELIRDVPFVKQKPDFCGEACAEMALRRLGHDISQDDVFALSGVDPALGRGVITRELVRSLRRLGFETGDVWHRVPRRRPRAAAAAQLRALRSDLADGTPSIVCMHFDDSPGTTQHFRLVVGYDADTEEVIFHDPALDDGAFRRLDRDDFLELWPLPYRKRHDILVRIPLKGRSITPPERAASCRHLPADFAQHVMRLQRTIARLEGRFHVVVEPPFVVIGDSGRRDLKQLSRTLIRRSVDAFKRLYFDKDPRRILDVWLFNGRTSYLTNTRHLVGHTPGTPFGFYSRTDNALIMNIKTGGGTLVHELVHPFVEVNFPACPPWLNEGLGSLYEAVGWPKGKIRGYVNWRLPGLQRALRAGSVPSFKALMAQNERQFYERDPGTNYSQSRYLAYYLQERGLLRTYYHRFRKNHATDPTGYATLQQVLDISAEPEMQAFRQRWEEFVLALRWR